MKIGYVLYSRDVVPEEYLVYLEVLRSGVVGGRRVHPKQFDSLVIDQPLGCVRMHSLEK